MPRPQLGDQKIIGRTIGLTDKELLRAKLIGNGSASAGVRACIRQYDSVDVLETADPVSIANGIEYNNLRQCLYEIYKRLRKVDRQRVRKNLNNNYAG